jgi:phenylalanyl-tRNA synthetase alpha chain
MKDNLNSLKTQALEKISQTTNKDDLNQIRIQYLGKKGELTSILKTLGSCTPEERAEIGKLANESKQEIEIAIESKNKQIDKAVFDSIKDTEWIDITQPSKKSKLGNTHPITQIQYELEDIFKSMGFSIFEGPELEDDYHNFIALNIPKDHPARDMQDTFLVR